jgi:hypothetical protein
MWQVRYSAFPIEGGDDVQKKQPTRLIRFHKCRSAASIFADRLRRAGFLGIVVVNPRGVVVEGRAQQ